MLQIGEVELAAEEGCDCVEGGGTDEAEHRVSEAECDLGGDEQKADQRRKLLRVHDSSLLVFRSYPVSVTLTGRVGSS